MPNGEISIRLNCSGVPCASRGFWATGKRISDTFSIAIIIWPSRNTAERALSVKVLIRLVRRSGLALLPLLKTLGINVTAPKHICKSFVDLSLECEVLVWVHALYATAGA